MLGTDGLPPEEEERFTKDEEGKGEEGWQGKVENETEERLAKRIRLDLELQE